MKGWGVVAQVVVVVNLGVPKIIWGSIGHLRDLAISLYAVPVTINSNINNIKLNKMPHTIEDQLSLDDTEHQVGF